MCHLSKLEVILKEAVVASEMTEGVSDNNNEKRDSVWLLISYFIYFIFFIYLLGYNLLPPTRGQQAPSPRKKWEKREEKGIEAQRTEPPTPNRATLMHS